jgi:hypothetical protein
MARQRYHLLATPQHVTLGLEPRALDLMTGMGWEGVGQLLC